MKTSQAIAVKERPIIFSAPMVRAILAGRKTQTRRILRTQPDDIITPVGSQKLATVTRVLDGHSCWFAKSGDRGQIVHCRHGEVGDRLWVRETWQNVYETPDGDRHTYVPVDASHHFVEYAATVKDGEHPPRWRSPIHMPRDFSRITLEITEVRVERVQEISHDDAVAEGMGIFPPSMSAQKRFREIWDHINGTGSWESNPWVWVVSFRRLDAASRPLPAARQKAVDHV